MKSVFNRKPLCLRTAGWTRPPVGPFGSDARCGVSSSQNHPICVSRKDNHVPSEPMTRKPSVCPSWGSLFKWKKLLQYLKMNRFYFSIIILCTIRGDFRPKCSRLLAVVCWYVAVRSLNVFFWGAELPKRFKLPVCIDLIAILCRLLLSWMGLSAQNLAVDFWFSRLRSAL